MVQSTQTVHTDMVQSTQTVHTDMVRSTPHFSTVPRPRTHPPNRPHRDEAVYYGRVDTLRGAGDVEVGRAAVVVSKPVHVAPTDKVGWLRRAGIGYTSLSYHPRWVNRF